MRQEVNLYTLQFRLADQPFSSRFLVRVMAVSVVVLLLVEVVAAWQLMSARERLADLDSDHRALALRVESLRTARPMNARAQLQQDIENLRGELERRTQLKSLIAGQKLGNAHGFSPYMEAVARQSSPDLSLTRIRLINGGDYLELGGWARKADAVPHFLHKLRNEESFEGVKFGTLGISGDPARKDRLEFTLGRPDGGAS